MFDSKPVSATDSPALFPHEIGTENAWAVA
jgi:hypothetical protein